MIEVKLIFCVLSYFFCQQRLHLSLAFKIKEFLACIVADTQYFSFVMLDNDKLKQVDTANIHAGFSSSPVKFSAKETSLPEMPLAKREVSM